MLPKLRARISRSPSGFWHVRPRSWYRMVCRHHVCAVWSWGMTLSMVALCMCESPDVSGANANRPKERTYTALCARCSTYSIWIIWTVSSKFALNVERFGQYNISRYEILTKSSRYAPFKKEIDSIDSQNICRSIRDNSVRKFTVRGFMQDF